MERDPSARMEWPPFERTLAGATVSVHGRDFTEPLGHADVVRTLLASERPPSLAYLPRVSIDLATRSAPSARLEATDLHVVGQLGEGGMGVVHLAKQHSLDRTVAVKMPRGNAPSSTTSALCNEAVVTGRLEHPNIVPVHSLGRTDDGRPVMIMKRLDGVSLRTLIEEPKHPLWDTIGTEDRLGDHLQILLSVANALDFAHSRSVVHRDVKPDNVMVGAFGEVVLVDFGLAVRVDRPTPKHPSLVGTPAYMAPEMVAGWPADARTDVYLLGATLFEAIVGRPPHEGATLTEVLEQAYGAAEPALPKDVPPELSDICRRAMARNPEDRYPDMRAFREALRGFLSHRASLRLANQAVERLSRSRGETTPASRRTALVEARFACEHALEQWSANPLAGATAREVAIESVALELDEHDAAGARDLIRRLDDPPPDLVARVDALERRLAEERDRGERLLRLEHDQDANVGTDARRLAVALVSLVAAGLSLRIWRIAELGPIHTRDLVGSALAFFLLSSFFFAAMWRRIAENAFGRRIATAAWIATIVLLFQRCVAAIAGEDVAQTSTNAAVTFAGILSVGGVLFDSRLLYGAALPAAAAVVASFAPRVAVYAFDVSMVLMLLTAALFYGPRRPPAGA